MSPSSEVPTGSPEKYEEPCPSELSESASGPWGPQGDSPGLRGAYLHICQRSVINEQKQFSEALQTLAYWSIICYE